MGSTTNQMVIRIVGTAEDFIKELDRLKGQTANTEKVLAGVAKSLTIAFAGFTAVLAASVKAYADYEKALIGVGKTADLEGDRLKNFGKEIQKLSSVIPVTTNDLLGIAQAAGQLGVKGEANLLKFADTIAKLGVATDLSGEQAATTLTRILTVTGEGVENIDKFGSVIVALGNNFAATESEIARMANEVARSTTVFGVTSDRAAALGTAMRAMGIRAELGGSAVGRSFRLIDDAVRNGGDNLANLSRITGVTGEQLQKVFAEDSTKAFQLFIEGLGRIDAAGGSSTEELKRLGLEGEEILKVLPPMAKNAEVLGNALNIASEEMKNATALNKEAGKAFDTLSANSQKLWNNIIILASNIGEKLAPAATGLVNNLTAVIKAINGTDGDLTGLIYCNFCCWPCKYKVGSKVT